MSTCTEATVTCPVCRIAKVDLVISTDGPRPLISTVEEFDPACECSESDLIDGARYRAALLELAR